jgi:hypothetical protein
MRNFFLLPALYLTCRLKVWNAQFPEAITSGQVKLQGELWCYKLHETRTDDNVILAHDFFTPQPVKNASIFLLKHILHDWSDAYCTKIPDHLRAAATSSTKLLLVDSILPYTCHNPNTNNKKAIPGVAPHEAPAPLLSNYGTINDMPFQSDFTVRLVIVAFLGSN